MSTESRIITRSLGWLFGFILNSSLSDKKKSLIMSTIVFLLLLLVLFFIRFWPPSNATEMLLAGGGGGGGVTINFGDSELGSGADYKSEVLNVKNETKQVTAPSEPDDQIIAQENATEESVVIPKNEKAKTTPKVVIKKETKPVVEKPKVTKNTNDALSSILSGSNKGGDGDDKQAGNKGKANGSLGSSDYYGNGGSGGGTGGGNGTGNGTGTGSGSGSGSGGGSGSGIGGGPGYWLGNRKALTKPKPDSRCSNEVGYVAVEITVDKDGNVLKAVPGVKGTTVTAKCLREQAKLAAMETKWQAASSDAAERQVGKIIYSFSLN